MSLLYLRYEIDPCCLSPFYSSNLYFVCDIFINSSIIW